ncbi:MAG TPA: rhomboid family intramembrane serine protease, partial [Aggregicoccus sp.]|nr:rhomboid family intramembrane serine protease [Aggregicoccus sp.]
MVSPRESRGVLEPLPTHEQAPEPRRRIPWVCGFVIAVSGALFLLQSRLALQVTVPGMGTGVMPRFALFGPLVRAGEYWRLLSYA